MTLAAIGHNSGFDDYWQLRMAVWDSKEPLVVKAMALAILEYMRPEMLESSVSRSRIQKMCGISMKTLDRHWDAICQWIEVIKSAGKRNVYRARIYACASELLEMVPDKPAPTMTSGHIEPAPTKAAPKVTVPPIESPPSRGLPPQSTPHSDGWTSPQGDGWSPRANKDLKNNNTNMSEDAKPETNDLVRVNGTAIIGPGFTLAYREIELVACTIGVNFEHSKLVAELAARQWAQKGFVPEIPSAVFGRVLAKNKIYTQVDRARLEGQLEKLRAEQTSAAKVEPSPRAKPANANFSFNGTYIGQVI
jgi:hypothetical protein